MSQSVSFNLAFILFFPTFCVIAGLYCWLPTKPRNAKRWIMDIGVVVIAFRAQPPRDGWGFRRAEGVGAPIWQQAASTLAAYAMFLGVLVDRRGRAPDVVQAVARAFLQARPMATAHSIQG